MNTARVAAAMVAASAASRKNADFGAMMGGRFFLKNVPTLAPQKDGNFSLVRVFRGDDELIADLDAATAETLLTEWLGEVVLMQPNEKIEARWKDALTERGWAAAE